MTPASRAVLSRLPPAASCRRAAQQHRHRSTQACFRSSSVAARSLRVGEKTRPLARPVLASFRPELGFGRRGLCAGGAASQQADETKDEEIVLVNFELPPTDIGAALKPSEVVDQLEKYIVGQSEAKRAVAIAMRNRWRRTQLSEELRTDVIPKNILMIGPTGCGKTEIARRLAKLSQAPFIKVEATKFTEVGFHGRDVDQIIKDLVEVSISMTRKQQMEQLRPVATEKAEEAMLDEMVGKECESKTRSEIHTLLREGHLEDKEVKGNLHRTHLGAWKVYLPAHRKEAVIPSISFMEKDRSIPDILKELGKISQGKRNEVQVLKIRTARPLMVDMELEKLLDMAAVTRLAIRAVEESGIVFIDEIDKICNAGDRYRGADASAEGVQRDLLPMIEGSSVQTKHGNVNTDFILFIASGAFHSCKPSDLLAELQGRLPIRVQLKGLTEEDMYRILTEPVNNLIRQQVELMKTENVEIRFTADAVREIARVAALVNKTVENIGARRLHTVLERIVEGISFGAADMEPGAVVTVDAKLVRERVGDMMVTSDLSKYII